MRTAEKAALALIVSGAVLFIAGIASGQSSASGGIVIFIGPIPVFVGFGDPSLLAVLLVMMAILTAVGFLFLWIGGRSGSGTGPTDA